MSFKEVNGVPVEDMPVSEELGVDLLGRQCGDSVAGVPIKKRKYHMARSPSPPSQISASLPREPALPLKDQCISEPVTPVSGIAFNAKRYSLADGRSFTDRNVNLSNDKSLGLNLLHSDVTCTSSLEAEINCKGKLTPEDESTFRQVTDNSGLLFSQKEPFQQLIVEEMSEGKPTMSNKSALRRVSASKEPLGLQIEGQNIGGSCQEQEKSYQSPRVLVENCFDIHHAKLKDLALSEEQSNVQTRVNLIESKVDGTPVNKTRSHWDLNTTMDTWEGSSSYPYINHATYGLNGLEKPAVCSKDMVLREPEDSRVTSTKCMHVESRDIKRSFDFLSCFSQELTCPSTKSTVTKGESDQRTLEKLMPPGNMKIVEHNPVKSEQLDWGGQVDFRTVESRNQLIYLRTPKAEVSDGISQEGLQTVNRNNLKLVNPGGIKSELVEVSSKVGRKAVEGISRLPETYKLTPELPICREIGQGASETVVKALDFVPKTVVPDATESAVADHMLDDAQMRVVESSKVGLKAVEGISHLPEIHKLTPELPICGEVGQGTSETIVKALDVVPKTVVPDATKSVVADCMLDAAQIACSEVVAKPKCSATISVDSVDVDSSAISAAAENDDDNKINISADIHEDDPYDSDNESDGSPNVPTVVRQRNDNDDDFEDGEVREPLLHGTSVEGICDKGEMACVSHGDLDGKHANGSGDPGGDGAMISSRAECTDSKTENPGVTVGAPCTGGHDSSLCVEKKEQSSCAVPCLKISSGSAVSAAGSGKKRSIKAIRRTPQGCSGNKEHGLKGLVTNSDQAVSASASHETLTDDFKDKTVSKQDSIKGLTDLGKVNPSNYPKTKPSVRVDEATRINRSRIINLPQASNGPSPGRTRSIPGAPMALRTERGRFPRTSLGVAELHPRGIRDKSCMDGHKKFERDRNIDRLSGNSGSDFIHMKGRVDNSSDALRGDRDSDRDFASRHYSSLTGARFPRPKNIAAVAAAAEIECNELVIDPDGNVVNSGKAWRKHVHDELENFRHLPFRRRSPDGRERLMPLGLPVRMVCRPPRVISPDRCISRGGPDMVVVRREEKFMRDLPDDMMDPLLSRPRSQYEGVRNPFIRRERSFSPIQRRGSVRAPLICSKSPPRSRSRSPCPWPSPRRSPDQFGGHPELLLHRSPPVFRGERMRSPPHQRPCFADAVMVRRHGSPPHISQLSDEMRKVGPLREHDHSRPFILNRSPSGRILQRNTRRLDMIDSRERVEGDEYFGPLHTGRFHELLVDDCVNERQKFRERCGPIRSFRPHDVGVGVERFRFREDGSRPYRFCPDVDAEFHEPGSPSDFEARINNRLGNTRRPRIIEEEEDNNRYGGQEWGEASFNDAVRPKRGRF